MDSATGQSWIVYRLTDYSFTRHTTSGPARHFLPTSQPGLQVGGEATDGSDGFVVVNRKVWHR